MNKKFVIFPLVVIIGIIVVFSSDGTDDDSDIIFHVTLADPNLYSNGVYTDMFTINKGEYSFRFVPNGSSPEKLSILLQGSNFDFKEDFKLENTLHQTGISEYFTWEYVGEKIIQIPEAQEITIVVNPNGDIMGSVSVDILEN